MRAPSQVTVGRAEQCVESIAVERDWAFRREAQHFVECVRDGTPFRSCGADSRNDLLVFDAVFRAAQSGGGVEICYES